MSMSDQDLLQSYACDGSSEAFAELVTRHLDLVYSVARRHVAAPAAEDVAQSVFIELARNYRRIRPGTPLVAWLHVISRRLAINAARSDQRRQAREQVATELASMKTNTADWSAIEPLLDEAIECLNDADRTAILLRYFENKPLRDVAAVLGTSDDAAQKRVSRALDELRAFLLRRGVTVTGAGLATDLSAYALQSAPAALGAVISSSTAVAFAALETSRTVAMATLQKTALVATVVALAGIGLFETVTIRRQRSELGQFRGKEADLRAELARARAAANPVSTRVLGALAPATAAPAATHGLEDRVSLLKQLLSELPMQRLPEIKLLAPDDWLAIAGNHELDTVADIRVALADLRAVARTKFGENLQQAMRRYLAVSAGQWPTDVAQLEPFLAQPADLEMLARYELIRAAKPGNPSEKLVREKATSDLILSVGLDGWDLTNNSDLPPAFGETGAASLDRVMRAIGTAVGDDAEERTKAAVALNAFATAVASSLQSLGPELDDTRKPAVADFLAAHPNETVTDVGQVLPYFKDSDAEKLVAALRPVFAQITYAHEHSGQMPASADQLQPYLTRPFSPSEAFRVMKLTGDSKNLDLDFDFPSATPGKP
jgi:RNA polymerase sigma factor (sigma-70 family)